MPIPDFQTLMLPVLQLAGDGTQHRIADMRERLAVDLSLTTDELAEKLKSGIPPDAVLHFPEDAGGR